MKREMQEVATELAVASAASKSTWGGALAGLIGWASSSQAVSLIGVSIAILGFLVNWYYRHKADRRATRLVDERIAALRKRGKSDTDLTPLEMDDEAR